MRIAKLRKLGRPITPRDLRNPERASGFDYVGRANSTGAKTLLWCARQGQFNRGTAANDWHGPCRRDPVEAAQDFCDRFNGNVVSMPAVLVTAGHEYEVDERDTDPEYQAALGVMRDRKAQRAGKQGYVYLIVESHPITGARDLTYGKIGYSTNPRKRVAELQTGNWRPLSLVAAKPGTEADERALHRKYIKYNTMQEWFRLTAGLLLEFQDHFVNGPTKVIERKAA